MCSSEVKSSASIVLKLEVVVGVDDGSPPVALTQSSFCKLATGFGATLHCQARSEKQRLLYDWTFTMGYYRHRLWHCTMLSSLSRPCLASPSCYSSSPPHKCFFKKNVQLAQIHDKEPLRFTRTLDELQIDI